MMRWAWLALAAGLVELVLVSSPHTPKEVTAAVESPTSRRDVSVQHRNITSYNDEDWSEAVAVLDYSYDAGLSMQLLASGHLVICMYDGCPLQELQSALLPGEVGRALANFLNNLGLADAFLIGSSDRWGLEVVAALRAQKQVAFNQVSVLNDHISQEDMLRFVGQVVKPAGTNLAVCVLQPALTFNLIKALHEYHLLESGFAYVFVQRGMWKLYAEEPTLVDGLLFVGDSDAALAKSRLEYEQMLLSAQIQALLGAVEAGQSSVRDFLVSVYEGKSRNCSSVLVNVQHAEPTVQLPLRFPGNSTVLPKLAEAVIYVSGDFSGLSSDGSVYPGGNSIVRGFVVANQEANARRDILPHFLLVNNTVSLGVFFDNSWALQQIPPQRTLLGAAYHAIPLSQNVMGITEDFRLLNISVPIATSAGSSRLSDPKEYPLFVRTISSTRYSATVMARFFRLFGWRRTAFVYSQAEEDLDYYRCFLEVSAQYGINISNSDANRLVPLSLPQEQLNATVEEILQSPVRIIIVSHLLGHLIAERMYDLGARAGDYLLLVPYGLSETYYAGTQESARKRREVAKGAMMFFSDLFVGEVGQSVHHRLAANGEKVYPYGCTFYDCGMLVAYALDFMVARGLHYEDGRELVKTMRDTRFRGCIGHVQIESGTNDKIPGDYVIINMQVDESFENVTFRSVARYSPFKTQLFNLTEAIQWPSGESSFSDSWPRHPQCPYYLRDIRDFPKGRMVGTLVCFVYASVAAGFAIIVWLKKCAPAPYPPQAPSLISVSDTLMLLIEPIDFLEITAVGPTVCLGEALAARLDLFAFVLQPILHLTQGLFWIAEIMAMGLTAVVLLSLLVKFLGIEPKLVDLCVVGPLYSVTNLVLPLASSALFLPAVFTFLSTFGCFESTGPHFSDSFLSRDCYERCWTGPHAVYSVLAAAFLALYTPIAILTRPLPQEWQAQLHFKATPSHLAGKSAVQVLLAANGAALRGEASAIVYFCVVSCYLVLSLCVKAYNYDRYSPHRANLWQVLIVAALWLHALVELLHTGFAEVLTNVWLVCLAIGYTALIVVGIALQTFHYRFRTLLIRRENPEKSEIIKFAFTFGVRAETHLNNFKAARRSSLYCTCTSVQPSY